jgi:DHA1 family tetracycline resistance protein-like MFS transporter
MLFVLTTILLDSMSLGLANPVMPRLIEQLTGSSPSEAGYIFGLLLASNSTMLFLAAPVIGRISDRVGRRPVIIVALFGVAVNSLIAATANSLPMLFVAQMIAGICGGSMSAAAAYVADVSPAEQRSQNFGLLSAVFGAGFVIGPSVGGLLAEFGLRLPFLAAAVLAALNITYGLAALPESLPPERRRPLSASGMLPFSALMRLPAGSTVRAMAIMLFLLQLGRVMAQTNWVLFMQYRFGWSASEVGISLGFWGLVGLLSLAWLPRILLPRIGERRGALAGLVIVMTACILYGSATRGWMIYPIIVFASVGLIAQPALQAMVSRQVGADRQGEIQGALTSLNGLGLIFGPIIANFSFSHFTAPGTAIQVPGAAFYLAAAAIGLAAVFGAITFRNATRSEAAAIPG